MKKIVITMVIMLAMVGIVFAGGKKETTKTTAAMKVAMVTDYGDITDQSFNQTTYEACKEFAEANGLAFQYYKPSGDSTEARVSSINAAIQDDFNVIVLPGYAFAEAIVKTVRRNICWS